MDKKRNFGVYVTFVLLIAVALGLWYFMGKKENDTMEDAVEAVGVLSEANQIPTETNPVKKVPDLSPTEKTNPFEIKNPFE